MTVMTLIYVMMITVHATGGHVQAAIGAVAEEEEAAAAVVVVVVFGDL